MISLYYLAEATRRSPDGGDEVDATFRRVDIDIVTDERYELSANITSHPVDSGTPVADHSEPLADTITLECVHSDSPNSMRADGAWRGETGLGGGGATVIMIEDDQTRCLDLMNELRGLVRDGLEVDTEGLRRDVEGYAVASVTPGRTADESGAMTFTLTLREIRRANTQTVTAPSPRVERGRRSRNSGAQPPQDTASTAEVSSEPAQRQSSAAALSDALAGWWADRNGGDDS